MDLLAHIESSCSSEDDDNTIHYTNHVISGFQAATSNAKPERDNTFTTLHYPCESPKIEEDCSDDRRPTKRPKRGAVAIIPSGQAPADTFQRSVPHRRGQWAGHIKIPVTNLISEKDKKRGIQKFRQMLELHGYSGVLVEHEDVHISMSKPCSLQISQIESFVRLLSQLVQDLQSFCVHVNTHGTILVNEEETRSFWCWTVHSNPTLLRLIQHVDSVLAKYRQPAYYQPPHFHISVASFPGNIAMIDDGDDSDDDDDDRSSDSGSASLTLRIQHIQCNFGTTEHFCIPLGKTKV
jgi:Uncharacterised conserved protein